MTEKQSEYFIQWYVEIVPVCNPQKKEKRRKILEEIYVVRVNLAWVGGTNNSSFPYDRSELHREGKIRAPPETDMSQPWFEITTSCTAVEHSSKELL